MKKPRILITSAAGKTGYATAMQLLDKDYPVRAFVKRHDVRAQRLKDAGAEIYVGDLFSIKDMREAMAGVQRAYHCAPTAPNPLHFGSVFAVAAAENKVEHVVVLSQWLSNPNHPSFATRETWLNESIIKQFRDMTVTVNNVGWFADNYFMVLEPAAQLGILPMPLGDGETKNNAPPSNEDIAAVNVGALIDPGSHAGRTYRPTGPDLLSPNDIADTIGRVLGRKVSYQNISENIFLKAITSMRPSGYSDAVVTQLRLYAEEYRRGTFAVGGPTKAVLEVGGREPESFEATARRVIAQRPEATQTLGNRFRAVRNFLKILVTPLPDVAAIEARRGHVLLAAPNFAQSDQEWLDEHDDQFRITHKAVDAVKHTDADISPIQKPIHSLAAEA